MEGKKIALFLIFCCLLVHGAAAYLVFLEAPRTVNAGEPIVVSGSGNLPPGFTTTISLSRTGTFGVIAQKEVTIQEGGNFSVSFDTGTLEGATYKVEIQQKAYSYGSGSKTWMFVDVINRTNELTLSSSLIQAFDGTLEVSGSIPAVGDSGLRLEVIHETMTIFGPEYIATRTGAFQREIPIEAGGVYTVILMDNISYRWIRQIVVTVPTTVPTTPVTTVTTPPLQLQASASASRTDPAYFKVETSTGILHVSSSSGVDWVMELIDESGGKQKINVRGTAPEETSLSTRGGTIYFKVYPDRFEDQASVTLYVENARTIESCPSCAALFGDSTPTTEAPLSGCLVFLAILAGIALWRRKS